MSSSEPPVTETEARLRELLRIRDRGVREAEDAFCAAVLGLIEDRAQARVRQLRAAAEKAAERYEIGQAMGAEPAGLGVTLAVALAEACADCPANPACARYDQCCAEAKRDLEAVRAEHPGLDGCLRFEPKHHSPPLLCEEHGLYYSVRCWRCVGDQLEQGARYP